MKISEESYTYYLSIIFFLVRTNRIIMSTHSKNKIEKLGHCSSSGQVAEGCCCIQHNNWSPNSKKSRVINLLPRSIEKQLREKGLLSGNFNMQKLCNLCEGFFWLFIKKENR